MRWFPIHGPSRTRVGVGITSYELVERLQRLAASGHGVFSAKEAADVGCHRRSMARALDAGVIWQRHPAVFVLAGRPLSFAGDLRAATLAAGGTTGSHRSALAIRGLLPVEAAPVEVIVPRPRRVHLHGVVTHNTGRLPDEHLGAAHGIPVTTLERSLCDVAAVVAPEALERIVDEAIRRGLDERRLAAVAEELRRPGPSGAARLLALLDRADRRGSVGDSWLDRLLTRVARTPGLPPAEPQYRIRDGLGRVVARPDVAFPVVRVAVEGHSDAWHYGPRRGERDRLRDRRLAELGWERVYLSFRETCIATEAIASLHRICLRRAGELGIDPVRWEPYRS